eukprot:SAG31_NODE_4157_length_3525_cov_1.686515_2_plen_93_part_00
MRATPYGELFDVLQSDAHSDLLALYPVILLVGEINFHETPTLLLSLESALKLANAVRQGTVQRIIMQSYHAEANRPLQTLTWVRWSGSTAAG